MQFRLHSTYVNNLKEESPFCNIFLLSDTRKNIYEFFKKQPPDVFYEKTVLNFLRTTILENIWERMVAELGEGSQ